MRCNSGIYKIINTINNKIYIGSAVNLQQRKRQHFSSLRLNYHRSIHLQRAFNKYGEEKFKFEVIEFIENKEILLEREQYWMDFYQSYNIENGYNICSIAGSSLGLKRTQETKLKLGKCKKGVFAGEKSYNTNLKDEDVKQIRKMLFEKTSYESIIKIFNISKHTLGKIKNNESWKHIIIPEASNEEIAKIDLHYRKINNDVLYQILELLKDNVSYADITKKFNLSRQAIYYAIKKYKNIGGGEIAC